MPHQPVENVVRNQTLNQPVTAGEERTAPSHGLYQPFFPLSEADFLRLKTSVGTFTQLGSVILTFAIVYALPIFVPIIRAWLRREVYAYPLEDLLIVGVLAAIGVLSLLFGQFLSGERRRVMKKIARHFEEHPGKPEFRT